MWSRGLVSILSIDLTVVDARNLVTLEGVTNDTKQKNLHYASQSQALKLQGSG